MDQRILELIHGDVDGELTPAEREELQLWLVASEEARQEHARAQSLHDLLAAVPARDPPAGLRTTVLATLPRRAAPAAVRAPARRRPRVGLAAALAATAAGVVFMLQREHDAPELDPASLSGTIARPTVATGAPAWRLEDPAIVGAIRLQRAADGLYMEVDVEAHGPITLAVRSDGRPLQVEGLVPIDEPTASPTLAAGGIRMPHSGKYRYGILLQRPAGAGQQVELMVYAGDRLVGETRLDIGRARDATGD